MSAVELSEHLKGGVAAPCGEKKVRACLRKHASFSEVYPGRFQIGSPLAREERLE